MILDLRQAAATNDRILANLERWGAAIAVVRYIDGKNGSSMWRHRWAKQARGTVLFAHPEDLSDVRVLSYKLPRGAEVKSFLHTKWGVEETQDFVGDAYSHLDDWTIKTCDRLMRGGSIRGHLSFKGAAGVSLANLSMLKMRLYNYEDLNNQNTHMYLHDCMRAAPHHGIPPKLPPRWCGGGCFEMKNCHGFLLEM